MKGVILAGGNGRRLAPITDVTNKHLLPIYNKPMIHYPLSTLVGAGMKEILVVCGREHAGSFVNLLGTGKEHGVRFSYAVQEAAGGIAQALALAADFARGDSLMVILGDNLFEDNFKKTAQAFARKKKGARVFLKAVPDPERFGVAYLEKGKVVRIEEKPKKPTSNLITTGLYMYDGAVFDLVKNLAPSKRGELEITDLNNMYVQKGLMSYDVLKGDWTDAGTFDSLLHAANLAAKKFGNGSPEARLI
ncbi:MAG: NTP transferase domain-containing protein [Candidatus Harrisonbacteria bacterium]|nr:NTP transferase domain-containing protein [Candidatus Harrisonbacteria bacterium]